MKQLIKIVLVAFSFLLVCSASAQSVAPGFHTIMNKIITGTPGVTNVPITGGVRASASGAVNVVAKGLVIPVATNVAADVSASAIAKGAVKIGMRAVPFVGTAVVLNDIANAVKDSGMTTCPPPDFFCKVGTPAAETGGAAKVYYSVSGSGGTGPYLSDPLQACLAYVDIRTAKPQTNGDLVPYVFTSLGPSPYFACRFKSVAIVINGRSYTENNFEIIPNWKYVCESTGKDATGPNNCPIPATSTGTPATPEEVNKALSDKANADLNWARSMKEKMDAVTAANPGLPPVIDVMASPLTITADPVTSPEVTVRTENIAAPDGTPLKIEVKESTKVTPQIGTPSTVADPKISYPSTTTQTTYTTNLTTNQTTTTITNINNPPYVPEPVQPQDLPKDYNREITQKQILEALTSPITAEPPTGNDQLESQKAKIAEGVTAVSGITEGSTGLRGWLPTINTSACVNPQVPTPITGTMQTVNICDSVNLFAKFFGAVISVFALYGCVREVQSAMKA